MWALISVAFSIGFTVGPAVGAAFSRWGSTGWFAAWVVYALTLAVANIIFFVVFFQELLPEGLMMMIPAFILIGANETNLGLYSGLTLYAIGFWVMGAEVCYIVGGLSMLLLLVMLQAY
ncbi:hypothetical protein O3P69_012717 [Scylla paramamosain]|uniref:Major facilitator superfamily (MFS) profile domain-containing protein n=1 Tax=Scylla paramamosain TaxID=85552 RepID=A0AAW0SHW7_SCYPA